MTNDNDFDTQVVVLQLLGSWSQLMLFCFNVLFSAQVKSLRCLLLVVHVVSCCLLQVVTVFCYLHCVALCVS